MRKKEGNKEQVILSAAIKVFAESGYHNAKVAKIAELANVATGSVYVYYENKEDLILKIFDRIWERLYNGLKTVHENRNLNSIEKFDGLIDLLFDVLSEDLNMAFVFVNEQTELIQKRKNEFTVHFNNFFDLGETIVVDGMKQGVFSDDLNVKTVRDFLFGGIRHLLRLWAANPQDYDLNEIRKNVKNFVKHGLLK